MKKPFKTYYGGKEAAGTYQTIINHIRPHHYFLEGFGGNYTISRKLKCKSLKLISEVNTQVYERYPESDKQFLFYNQDYRELIDFYMNKQRFAENMVIYLDPPYLLESRKSDRLVYNSEFETIEKHTEMLELANAYKNVCDIIISHYPHPLYFEKLKGWNYHEFQSQTRNGPATEGLWFNYEVDELADYQYLGTNRVDRQRIKRRIRLLKQKIKALPTLERKGLLKSLSEIK